MTPELQMVWRQLEEVIQALRVALDEIPDDRLYWRPAPDALPAGLLAQHVARANVTYSHFMAHGQRPERTPYIEDAPREVLSEKLDASLERVRGVFEEMTPERLSETVSDGWAPIGAEIEGPLTPLWFAYTMLTHSAYHVGQMNTISMLAGLGSP